MPFDKTKPIDGVPLDGGTVGISEYDAPDPSFLDTVGAAFRQDNIIGSALSSKRVGLGTDEFFKVDPSYDPFSELTGYEDHADRFENAYNPKAVAAIKADIDKEKRDQQTLAASGWTGVAVSFGAQFLDPTILLPAGALARTGKIGYSGARSALTVGAGAAASTAVQESVLQATQETRAGSTSALAIGGSAILGGLIGFGASKFLSKGEWDRASASVLEDVSGDLPDPAQVTDTIVQRMQSAGAAAVDEIKLDDLGFGGDRAAQIVANATNAARINPGIRTMFSPSVRVRETYAKLIDNPVYTRMEMEGKTLGPSVENLVKQYDRGALSQWIKESRSLYKQAKKAGFSGTKQEFYDRVTRAGRRSDVDEGGNEFITRAARIAREKIYDPSLERAIKSGLLPEDVKTTTAASYVTRFWNRQKLIGEEDRFREIAREYFREELARAEFRQEEVAIGRQVVQADELSQKYDEAFKRLSSVEQRLEKRQAVRRGKVASIDAKANQRFDMLRGRVQRDVLEVAKAAKASDSAVDAIRDVRAAAKQFEKRPVLSRLKALGGVRTGSPLAAELNSMGITPKSAPGLFIREGGRGALDNIVAREDEIFARLATDENGYVLPDEMLAAIRDELAGMPLRTDDEIVSEAATEAARENAKQFLSGIGLDETVKVSDVRKRLDEILRSEANLDSVDLEIQRMNAELDDFDTATEVVVNEQMIAKAEAGVFADELEKLEIAISEFRDIAQSSPRVKIIVDYALAKRAMNKGRYQQARIDNRIAAIDRVEAEGRLNNLLDLERKALRSDKVDIDGRVEKARGKVDKLKPMLPKRTQELPDFVDDADRNDYIEEVVTSVFNNLTGRGVGDVPEWIVPVTRGPLKERTFRIQDALVEDFLENDAEAVLRRYSRIVGAEIEIAEKFGRADMRDQFDAINKEYDELAKAATDPKKRAELDVRRREDIRNLEAFRDLVRGTYRAADESSVWSAITRGALTWNLMRLLGGVTLTSMTDASRPIAVHGLRATMREAMPALVSNTKAARIARQDAKDLGAVTEAVSQTRWATLAELQDPYRYGSPYERFLSNASNIFIKATGLAWWNDTIKTISAVMTQNRMARNAIGYGSIGKKERAYMAFLGIDENMAGRIARQVQKHGLEERGIWGANVSAWDDDLARRSWAAALNKDVDRTIVTKGAADQPLWTRTNTGRLIMQFKSFGLASHQRVLMAGLQENPLRLAESMVFATTLGMLISYLKFVERGDYEQANRLVDNPGLWISNGLDRSGILSIPYEISNTAEKIGLPVGITTAAQAVAGDPDKGGTVSRYASRNKLGAVLGPSAGLFQDLTTIAEQLSQGDVKKSGTNAMIRQIPGGSLPGVRTGLHGFIKPAIQD